MAGYTRERRRRTLCTHLEAAAIVLELPEFADTRPNAVAYLRGLEREIEADVIHPAIPERRAPDEGVHLVRSDGYAILALLQQELDQGVVLAIARYRVQELREKISAQLG
jgi:hypothetical protein